MCNQSKSRRHSRILQLLFSSLSSAYAHRAITAVTIVYAWRWPWPRPSKQVRLPLCSFATPWPGEADQSNPIGWATMDIGPSNSGRWTQQRLRTQSVVVAFCICTTPLNKIIALNVNLSCSSQPIDSPAGQNAGKREELCFWSEVANNGHFLEDDVHVLQLHQGACPHTKQDILH
jgi:hypothetical protein